MKKVYTNQNIALVGAMRSYLEENNIVGQIRNEFSSSVMGEVAFFDVWPELWVRDDNAVAAEELLCAMQQSPVERDQWDCHVCKESNPGTFGSCWQCGQRAGAS